jgi:hypothetical protein
MDKVQSFPIFFSIFVFSLDDMGIKLDLCVTQTKYLHGPLSNETKVYVLVSSVLKEFLYQKYMK